MKEKTKQPNKKEKKDGNEMKIKTQIKMTRNRRNNIKTKAKEEYRLHKSKDQEMMIML